MENIISVLERVDNLREGHMTTIMPQSELVKKAVAFINERLKEKDTPLHTLLDNAGMRFNLSPKEAEMLKDFFKQSKSND